MSEKIRISEYKGFELWDTPMPEGWRVHSYPVQVTCNGEHVNNFADANEAMSVIDGMDADTIAYHKRQARAHAAPAQPTPAGGGATADFDELLTQLSNSLSNHAISMLRTHFAAEHSIRTRVEAQLAADDSGYSELIDELSGKIKALERENATMIRELAMLEGERNRLRQQLAAAQAERDAAVALVNKAHKVLQDVERWLPTTENFDLGANHYSEVHSAWKAGAWIRNYWLHLSEQDSKATSEQ